MEKRNAVIAGVAAASAATAICISSIINEQQYNHIIHDLNFDNMLRNSQYNDWFRQNLKCSQATFEKLVLLLQEYVPEFNGLNHVKHSFKKKLAMTIYFLCTQGGYRESANVFGVSKSWMVDCVSFICEHIKKIRKKIVTLPHSQIEWDSIEKDFYSRCGFPGVVGAVDGSLIEINRPSQYEGFYCRKSYPALNMQAVVDSRKRFIDVDIRPGSYSDRKIWKISKLGRTIRSPIPSGTHIVGDAGYTLSPWLLTPYIESQEGSQLSKKQKKYNYLHSSTRMAVEGAFGLLKGRFRTLQCAMGEKSLSKTVTIIIVCIILHNLLIDLQDDTIIHTAFESDITPDVNDIETEDMTQILRSIATTKRNSTIADTISHK